MYTAVVVYDRPSKAFKGINGTLLFGTLAIVIVLLLITYRSPLLWLLPVISAGVALTTAEALIYLLAVHAGLTVNAQSAGILDVLVFGAGTRPGQAGGVPQPRSMRPRR